jgi:hypothetical protein
MTTNEGAVAPAALLREVGALRRRTRADRHAYWFPLLLFGVLTLGSLPLYVERWPCGGADVCSTTFGPGQRVLFALGGSVLGRPLIGWYWLAALLVGGLATVWWYRWHARRRGVQGRVGVALLVGLVVLGALLGAGVSWLVSYPIMMANLHGTAAFLVIAVGLLALVWLERSVWLAVVALGYAVAAGLAIFYDVVNLTARLGWYSVRYSQWPNVLLPALVLLIGGAVAAAGSRRSRA